MKKRFFSIFLALALCVTLLPAAALADGEEQAKADQLYRVNTDNHMSNGAVQGTETTFAVDATGSPARLFAIKNGDSYTVIRGSEGTDAADGWSVQYKSTDGTVTKTLAWESEDDWEGWRWQSPGQLPGGTGTITATKGDESYSMAVTIGAAELGVYTTLKNADNTDVDVDAPGTAYVVPEEWGNYTVDASLVKTVYVKPGYDYITILPNSADTPISSSNSNVTCSLDADGVLTITNGSDTTQTATIQFWVKYGNNEPDQWEYTIRFASATQLYKVYTDDTGKVCDSVDRFTPSASGGELLHLAIKQSVSDSSYTVITGGENSGWSVQYKSADDTVTKTLTWEPEKDWEGWRWQSAGQLPGSTGKLIATKGDESYSMDVTIGAAEIGAFTRKDADVTKGTYYVLPGDESGNPAVDASSVKTVYVKPGYDYVTIVANSETTPISSDNDKVTCTLGEDGILAITNTYGTAQTATIKFYVKFDGDDSAYEHWYSIDFILPSRDMTDGDYILGSDIPAKAVEFTYKGIRYYMGPRFSGKLTPGGGAMNFVLAEGEYGEIRYDIGFWTRVGDEYYLVTDETLRKELEDAFDGTLRLTAYALRSDDAAKPEKYPAIYSWWDNDYPCAIAMKAGLENRATWVFVATGTVNGTTLAAASSQEWEPFKGITYTPDLTKDAAGKIADVNAFLAGLTAEDNTTVRISLPAGEYKGYIVVPDWDKRVNVQFCGELGDDEKDSTYLHGGIYSTSKTVAVHAEFIFFWGNGKDATASAYTGYSNYAIYGGSHSGAGSCIIKYYDIALYGGDCDGSIFVENNIGIYIDATNADSNGEYYGSHFEGNNVAIQFHDVGTRAMTSYELVKNRFISNVVDIKNEITTKVLFAPGNYFGTRNEDHSFTARLCYVSGLAYCYPQAADDTCSSYQYSFAWYVAEALKISETYETIVVSNETAGSYLIPKDDLTEDTSITVKKEDGTTTGKFDFNNKGGDRA